MRSFTKQDLAREVQRLFMLQSIPTSRNSSNEGSWEYDFRYRLRESDEYPDFFSLIPYFFDTQTLFFGSARLDNGGTSHDLAAENKTHGRISLEANKLYEGMFGSVTHREKISDTSATIHTPDTTSMQLEQRADEMARKIILLTGKPVFVRNCVTSSHIPNLKVYTEIDSYETDHLSAYVESFGLELETEELGKRENGFEVSIAYATVKDMPYIVSAKR